MGATLVSTDGRGGADEPFGSRGRGLAPAAGVHVGSFVGCAAGTRARCCFDVGWLLDGCGAPRADRGWCPGQHRYRGCRHLAGYEEQAIENMQDTLDAQPTQVAANIRGTQPTDEEEAAAIMAGNGQRVNAIWLAITQSTALT